MIYAVGAGLVVIFVFFVLLTTLRSPSESKAEMISETLEYLKKTQGVIEMVVEENMDEVKIVYDGNDAKDFIKIARYAVLKLSNRLRDTDVRVTLFKDREADRVYSVTAREGSILVEER